MSIFCLVTELHVTWGCVTSTGHVTCTRHEVPKRERALVKTDAESALWK